jgi:cytoskeletal protein RodZ
MVISVMESIGTILRHERERRGLSVQEVFESTKITVLNVEALELDRFESFPNKVYARAFLRDYANFLDLDSGALLQRYESEWFASPSVEPQPTIPEKRKSSAAWVVAVVLILVIAAGAYIWLTYYSGDMVIQDIASSVRGGVSDYTTESSNTTDKVVPLLPPTTNPLPEVLPVTPVAPPVANPTVLPTKPATGLELTVSALKQNVWIKVTGDGDKQLFQQELKPGESKSWNAKYKFKIRCGRLHAVKVKLNGNTVKLKPDPKNHTSGGAVFKLNDVIKKTSPGTP